MITQTPPVSTIRLTSTAFANNGLIPTLYTCEGKSVNPPLSISGVPAAAESLVLIMEDPDAPVGIWDHWILFNIDPDTTFIPEGAVPPPGLAGMGTAGTMDYVGPCPPAGMHRYLFTIYALDAELALRAGSAKLDLVGAMNGHVLDQAQLIGKYEKIRQPAS